MWAKSLTIADALCIAHRKAGAGEAGAGAAGAGCVKAESPADVDPTGFGAWGCAGVGFPV